MKKEHCTAIVLAAGQGSRMGTKVQKTFLEIGKKPMIYYPLKTFQQSPLIDEIILVVGKGQEEFCRKNIVETYHFSKVTRLVEGGTERYHSVWNGLQVVKDEGYVFIHDGARPFIDQDSIARAYEKVIHCRACVVGMPVKDTIKVADENDFVRETPDRSRVWISQTPQVFQTSLVKDAYSRLMREDYIRVTDDAMVVEMMLGYPVKMVCGTYENIKITTSEDLVIGEVFAKLRK